MEVSIRPARTDDLPQILPIFEHYVLNTVVSFLIQKPPRNYIQSRFEASTRRGLPYLVAEEPGSGKIVGYTYASPFRGFMLGYGHTVEISLFCHPEHTRRGIGAKMMAEMLAQLKQAKHISQEEGHDDNVIEFEIKNVMAIMAVDDTAQGNGLARRDWYLKWGFEQVGRLKGVGFKQGRVLDTIYLELHL